MAKKKLSTGEKKLKALLSEKGALTMLQNEMRKIFDGHPSKDDVFIHLERMLVVVSNFQDKHHKTMDSLKVFFKGNEKIMVYLGPLHVHIKTSGRDLWKSDKHRSFVKNKAGIVKSRLSAIRPKYEEINDKKIFFVNDFYDTAQPLSFIRSPRATGIANKAMISDLRDKVELFVEENYNKITCNIGDLRDLLK